jgi:hypothetical protein
MSNPGFCIPFPYGYFQLPLAKANGKMGNSCVALATYPVSLNLLVGP